MNKNLILIKSIDDFNCAQNNELIHNEKIITFSFGVQYELKQAGIKSIPIWNIYKDSELNDVLEDKYKIINGVWLPFFKESKQFDYAKVAMNPLIYFLNLEQSNFCLTS